MNNVIYECTTRKAQYGRRPALDIRASILYVTAENNGYHVWFNSHESGLDHLKWFNSREEAIEYGVDTARRLKAAAKYAEEHGLSDEGGK